MSVDALQGGMVFAGYRIERELGQGAMATVFLAEDPKHRRSVALKVLKPELGATIEADRFLREIEIAAALTHPNILPVFDSGEESGRLYYVMPCVDGGSLRQRLNEEGSLPVADAVRITGEVADALSSAHERGVVHRDIKPENILLEHGHPVVADFGMARASAVMRTAYTTGSGIALGTPAYMSPEQASGESTVDHRADQYALACVLYEMLAGHPPFVGGDARATMARHVTDPPPPLATIRPGIPAAVRRAVTRALAKAPADRYATTRAFADALVATVADHPSGRSIAVLPFVNLSGNPEDDFFGDGMAEEIIGALVKIEGLRVASRTSTFALRGKRLDIAAIGELLNVEAVLEGSVRRAGNTLRVTAQLVSAESGAHLWSGRFDREPKDIFAIHDDIASNIARAFRVVLQEEARRTIATAPTTDLGAYDYYLRGRQFFHQRRRKSMMFARQMFMRAVERDPSYARAHAGIADTCSFLVHHYQDENTPANLEQADAASQRALALDPDLPEAHAARGFALSLLDRFPEAEQESRRAMDLDPHQFEARYFYARACFQRGELPRALELFADANRAREDHEASYFVAQTLLALGRTDDATAAYRRALPVIERHLELNPDDARTMTMAGVCCSRLGERARGFEWARMARAADPEDASVCYNVACLFALEGEAESAIENLECAFRTGFARREWIEQDPDLESLRDEPRFQALLREKLAPLPSGSA
jgi:TolB-like protein/Flp pilus assembly protein TadD/tRNA A-37 threonylcarbamoyl transferase component Bud32